MTPETMMMITTLIQGEYNRNHGMLLHLKHQLSIEPEYRITEYTEDELREQWEAILKYDLQLKKALEEIL